MLKQITRSQFNILSKLESDKPLVYEEGNGDESGYYLQGNRVNAAVIENLIKAELIETTTIMNGIAEHRITEKGCKSLRTMQYNLDDEM